MNINLYPCFSHWLPYNNIFVYSDPHFGDEEMKFIRHNYVGDDEQVRRINSKVGKKDIIIFLGDIGDVEFIKKIRGRKVLVMGNHDAGATNYRRRAYIDGEGKAVDTRLFDEVYEGVVCINEKVILSHEPVNIPFLFNIHGHDHSGWSSTKGHKNVCAEHINYTPVPLKDILLSGDLKYIESIHRATIDEATERSKKKGKTRYAK